jgi:hypothetical protein
VGADGEQTEQQAVEDADRGKNETEAAALCPLRDKQAKNRQ